MTLPPPRSMPPIPEMQAFALAFDLPRPSIADVLPGAVGWRGTGPLGVPIFVRGDGVTIFDFPKAADFRGPPVPGYLIDYVNPTPTEVTKAEAERVKVGYARLQYMNAWTASYMAGMGAIAHHSIITPQPVDPHLHLKAVEQHGAWHAYDNEHRLIQDRADLTPVQPQVFDHALAIMSSAYDEFGENFTTSLALFQQACFQYRIHQFATAHIAAWSLAEQALNILWRRYQLNASCGPNQVTSISKKRGDILNGRDFTASIITQTLSLAGRIDDERLAKLDRARRSRNAFAHSLSPISGSDAENALTTAADMLSDLLSIRLYPNLSNTFWI